MSNTSSAASPASNKTYRVVQWAAGRIGQSSMRAIIRHPRLELVGLHVHSESKEGRDAGELCGLEPIGVKATRSIDAVIALKPDCVMYMQEGYNIDDVCALLEAGINIVTTRNEFFYAKKMDSVLRERTEAACKKGGASIHATGSSPGFITEAIPVVLSSLSTHINCITIDEFADIPASTSPEMIFNVMGYGRPATGEFNQQLLDHHLQGFTQSLQALADALSLGVNSFKATGEYAAANTDIKIANDDRVIEKGTIAAQRINLYAMQDDKPRLHFRINWYCSTDIDKPWELGGSGWRVVVDSDTPLDVSISFPRTSGDYADQMSGLTAHRAVNAVPNICEAAPGIWSTVQLPQVIAQPV